MASLGSQFTCISCRVAFASADLQRAHYKSDWHRYNLKRKVAELPPVTAAEFKQRVLAQQSKTAEESRDASQRCDRCSKQFRTENAYTNHLQSRKHKELEAKAKAVAEETNTGDLVSEKNAKNKKEHAMVDAYEGEKMKREGAEKIKQKKAQTQDNMAASVSSPSSSSASASSKKVQGGHGDVEMDDEDDEWDDIEGEEIPTTNCLFCAHSSKTMEENLSHMTVSHSFFLPNLEYLVDMEGMLTHLGLKVGCDFMCVWCNDKGKAFFSLEAVQRHMRDKGHCKLLYEGDAIYEFSDFYDYRKSYPDFEERNEGAVGGGEEEEEEMEVGNVEIQDDGFELTLPSGAKIGHRELSRYYKQNLPLERRVIKRNPALIGRLMTQYKALGWHGNKGEAGERMMRDLRYVQKFKSKQMLRVQMKANSQKHFRSQNPI